MMMMMMMMMMVIVQLDSLLALDMVSVAERGLGSVLADSPDLFRHTFRRGELYSAATSSTRGVQCQLLTTTANTASTASTSNHQLHWTYGPDIYRHLRDVRISTRIVIAGRGAVGGELNPPPSSCLKTLIFE